VLFIEEFFFLRNPRGCGGGGGWGGGGVLVVGGFGVGWGGGGGGIFSVPFPSFIVFPYSGLVPLSATVRRSSVHFFSERQAGTRHSRGFFRLDDVGTFPPPFFDPDWTYLSLPRPRVSLRCCSPARMILR